MKHILCLLLFVAGSIAFAQDKDELKAQAIKEAKIASQATLDEDFKTVVEYTYPEVLKLMGGKEKAVAFIKSSFDALREDDFVFEKADVLSASDVIFEDDEYRCYIENFNQMVIGNMRVKSKSYLLGIYDDNVKHWYFLEAKQLKNQQMVDMVLPNFETSLNIPEDETTTEMVEN